MTSRICPRMLLQPWPSTRGSWISTGFPHLPKPLGCSWPSMSNAWGWKTSTSTIYRAASSKLSGKHGPMFGEMPEMFGLAAFCDPRLRRGSKDSMNLDQLFACNRGTFRDFYGELRRCFEAVDCFHVVEEDNCSKLPWPIGQGVYAIWQGSGRTASSLVYVGMTGKMSNANGRTELPDKPRGFRARAERTNPYSFTSKGPFENHFEFGPTRSGALFCCRFTCGRLPRHCLKRRKPSTDSSCNPRWQSPPSSNSAVDSGWGRKW